MTVLLLLAVVVLVLLNGYFVAAEFALVRVRRSRMEEDDAEGRRSAGLVLRMLDGVSLFLAALITTSLHITIGEQVPKIYAINKAERVARAIARPLQWFTVVFSPFIAALNGASNGILRLIGIRSTGEFDEGGSPAELKMLISQSLTGGQLEAN